MGLDFKCKKGVCGVYSITNTINNKSYIGCTKDINKRMIGHRNLSKKQDYPLYREVREYGRDAFEVKILEECLPSERLTKEIYWIKKMNSKFPNGYNLTEGGAGVQGNKQSLKTKEKKSKALLKYWENADDSKRKTGAKNNMFGKHHSKEAKRKIGAKTRAWHKKYPDKRTSEKSRQKLRDYYKSHRNPMAKRVDMMDYNTSKILLCFPDMSIAGAWVRDNTEYIMGSKSGISRNCTGNTLTSYGYKWQYNNEGN